MAEDFRESTESLSVDQLLAAISRIDSALQEESFPDENPPGENHDLETRCSILETKLAEEQAKRRQLETAYGSIISTTYELNKELAHLQGSNKWRNLFEEALRENEALVAELKQTKEMYAGKIEELTREFGKVKAASAVYEGNREALMRLPYVQLVSAEKQLLKALSVLHDVKSVSASKTESSLCVICEERKLGVLLRPCNHVCTCEPCAGNLQTCPICRARISGREKVYIQ